MTRLDRRIALFSMLPVVLGLAVVPCLAAQENLALNRPYVCSDDLLLGWTGLTDGVTDSDAAPGCFATGLSTRYPKRVIIDLGALCTVSRINVINSRNGNTRHVALHVSPDAATYEQLREYIFPAEGVQTLAHSFTPRKARYVRLTMHDTWGTGAQGADCLFLREIQVLGDPPPAGTGVSGREELRLARVQPQFTRTPAVVLFRRYGLVEDRKLRIGVLGDSLAAVTTQQARPWPELLPALFKPRLGGGEVELYNLAAEQQRAADGLAVIKPLLGTPPVDLLVLTYGRDAALAGIPVVDFRNSWQDLVAELLEMPALLVVLTPPPLVQETGAAGRSVLAYAQVQEDLARQYGLPVVRGGAALAATPDPLACFQGAGLSAAGHAALAEALQRLLWDAE